ncbi:hypothetical protein KSS87_021701 [Heliosperma pusillum]|nr:hypothetical protein KSS87_021701 [Heliosperma pusillum]
MGRNSVSVDSAAAVDGDVTFRCDSERALSLFKRTHRGKLLDRHLSGGRHRSRRKTFQLKGNSMIYWIILLAVFGFALASMLLQSSITSVFRQGGGRAHRRLPAPGITFGTFLSFHSPNRFLFQGRRHIHHLRMDNTNFSALRPPKLALILGNLKKNPESLMLFTVMKNLRHIGYMLKLYALKDGEARAMWEEIGGHMTILNLERYGHFDWSLFEGVIVDSVEVKDVIWSLMQEPFCSVPLVWIIQEDSLAKRLLHYNRMEWKPLISHWRYVFSRADVVVFPDFSLPMLYSSLDSGNFFVIPGTPIDVWAAESYVKNHSKAILRMGSGYSADDVLVLVLGNSVFYNELSWEYAVAMHTIGPLLTKYAKRKDDSGSFKFIFLCGNASEGYDDALKGVATRLRLNPGSLGHYRMDHDVNGAILMADIVLHGSSHEEQAFPPLLKRAMSFGIPIVVPDISVTRRYVVDGVHGMIFSKHNPDDLLRAFSGLIANDKKLSKFGKAVGSAGKLLARNLLASESIAGYAKLMENILSFPSEVFLPAPTSEIQQDSWDWNSFIDVMEQSTDNDESNIVGDPSIFINLEEQFSRTASLRNNSEDNNEFAVQDMVSAEDVDDVEEIASFEEFQRLEMDQAFSLPSDLCLFCQIHVTVQIDERMGKDPGTWDEIYRNARKSEKLRFEVNERDEGELQRTGRLLCIYEVYSGAGAWPLLHHGSLYRGLSLSRRTRRLSSDDVDAAYRLPLLNDSRYHDALCEMGGLFSIAYKVDDIHKRPWIGFQSWRASGKEVSLSVKAEKVLEETIQHHTKGDVMYFWTSLDLDRALTGRDRLISFWSICDALNRGHCRSPHMVNILSSIVLYWRNLHVVQDTSSKILTFTQITSEGVEKEKTSSGEELIESEEHRHEGRKKRGRLR